MQKQWTPVLPGAETADRAMYWRHHPPLRPLSPRKSPSVRRAMAERWRQGRSEVYWTFHKPLTVRLSASPKKKRKSLKRWLSKRRPRSKTK